MFGKLPTLIGRTITVQVRFDYAGGVTKDTPVRKSGILIGRVSDVQLTDNDAKVLVTLEIQSDKTIYQNEDCYITRDLLGDTALVVRPRSASKPGADEPIEPDTILKGRVSDDPTGLKRALQEPDRHRQNTGKALTDGQQASSARPPSGSKTSSNDDAQQDVADILRDAAESLKVIQKRARRRGEPDEARRGHEASCPTRSTT